MNQDSKRMEGSLRFRRDRTLTAPPGAVTVSWIARYEAGFVLAAAMGVVLVLVRSARRPFWFDELFTFYISRLPHIDQLFQAIPADGNPPLSYILVRLCLRLFGETELSTRLPSILAFAAALLATYLFVRRRCSAGAALFGMFALAASGIATYGNEARPYALLLGFTGLTMVSWQAVTEKGRARLIPLLGVVVGIAGAIASHHYGVFHVGVPLAFGEAVRLAKRRRFDFPLYCACAVGLSMIAVTAPFAHETQQIMLYYVRDSISFWAKPHVRSVATYRDMVNLRFVFSFFALLLLTNLAFKRGAEPAREGDGIPAHEVAAAVGLALLVPIMIGVTWATTGYYLPRYAIGAAMGIAILMGIAAHRLGGSPSPGSPVASLCMVFVALAFVGPGRIAIVDRMMKAPVARVGRSPSLDSALGAASSQEPIVVASALAYMPEWWYASPPLRGRLHYLADLPFAVRQADFLPELSLVANQPFVPSKVDAYREFLTVHSEFLLYCVGEDRLEWTKERLRAEGWTLHLLHRNGQEALFLAQAPNR